MTKEITQPQRRRRKEARPTEILDAATSVFAEKGYAGTNLNEVAKRAGVSKGTLYRYFDTKEDIFRAVAQAAFTANLEGMEKSASGFNGSVSLLIPMLLKTAAGGLGDSHIPAIVRMVIAESRQFPDLARIWHDNVVVRMLNLLTTILAEGQMKGEIRQGDPHLQALSIVGPMITAVLFREVFCSDSGFRPELLPLAESHSDIVLRGLMA
ncbi:TetR/AcrR family transcriptional regulator [Leclercia adecarboxylata]|uniref:TetR/AcrR family transcriptional regulator n=1 Tax=Leclercia adecarboxylata TaxID=83655 RepID=UPI002DB7C4D1|nr:TetR/AcrR family transcriptional regulator [Leclercia adecarboxylata]MEB6381542.1 TetR/AcrR family transcriptional regulator [Leclercia adecarboxylata]